MIKSFDRIVTIQLPTLSETKIPKMIKWLMNNYYKQHFRIISYIVHSIKCNTNSEAKPYSTLFSDSFSNNYYLSINNNLKLFKNYSPMVQLGHSIKN